MVLCSAPIFSLFSFFIIRLIYVGSNFKLIIEHRRRKRVKPPCRGSKPRTLFVADTSLNPMVNSPYVTLQCLFFRLSFCDKHVIFKTLITSMLGIWSTSTHFRCWNFYFDVNTSVNGVDFFLLCQLFDSLICDII